MAKQTGRVNLPMQAATDTNLYHPPSAGGTEAPPRPPVPAPEETEYPELAIFPPGLRPLSPVGHPQPGPPQV